MSGQDHRAPEAPVEHPPRGFNGLPEIEDLGVAPTDLELASPPRLRSVACGRALAPWAGVAAVAAIVVPAVVAYRTLRRRGRQRGGHAPGRAVPSGATGLTAAHGHEGTDVASPHGDKLLFRPQSGHRAAPRRLG